MEIKFKCPECHGENVTATAEESFMANTGEHYCHSVKYHDADARANCLDCQWQGRRDRLIVEEIPRRDRKINNVRRIDALEKEIQRLKDGFIFIRNTEDSEDDEQAVLSEIYLICEKHI